jgi:hypothetical protein
VRTYLVQLPCALLLAVVAIQVVVLSLSATDAMSDAVAGGSGADVSSLLSTVTKGLVVAAADPTIASFVLLLIALLIAVAAFVLWMELLIRAAAVYVAVLFLPLALATLVWPAVSHWCRRLVETLAALILSKFVIVATLSLAAGAVASGASGSANSGGFNAVLAGGALLVMATFVPFAILRLIPAIEAGAVGHLEGLRQRGSATLTGPLRTAATFALQEGLQSAGAGRLLGATAAGGALGSGGADGGSGSGSESESGSGSGSEGTSTDPKSGGLFETPMEMYDELMASGGVEPRPKGPKPLVGWSESSDGAEVDDPVPSVPALGAGANVVPTEHPTGTDAWKYKDLPAGKRFLYPVYPGVHRFYIDHDAKGLPKMVGLPPVWPPDDAEGET